RRIRTGDRVVFAHGEAIGVFRGRQDEVLHILEVQSSRSVEDLLQAHGEVPLPPYIDRPASVGDETNYQTVFASKPGAVAAPTAGLHFTERTLQSLRSKKIEIAYITLHVGVGTFLPVRTDSPEEHLLRPERYEISETAAELLRCAQHDGRRI